MRLQSPVKAKWMQTSEEAECLLTRNGYEIKLDRLLSMNKSNNSRHDEPETV